MRRLLTVLVAFSILVVSGAKAGVEKGQIELSTTVGAGIPLGDFGDVAKAGVTVGAQLSYYVSPNAAIGLSGIYNSFGVQSAFQVQGVDQSLAIIEITGNAKILLGSGSSGNTTFYLKLAAGVFNNRAKASAGGISLTITETDFGFGGGLGLQFKGAGNVGGFVEALFFDDLTEGGSTQYVNARGGVSFFFGGDAR